MTQKFKAHVLVIDDEESIRVGLADYLELEGFKADYRESAEKGIIYLEENPDTDIVLLDINLGGGLSGIEALPFIKEKCKCVQVVMLSSVDTLETAVACMQKGASDYMTKPFNEKIFFQKLDTLLSKKQFAQLNELYLGILIHDLKNPVASIKVSLDALQLTFKSEFTNRQNRLFNGANRALNQISIMISNILNIAKFEKGINPIKNSKFLLDELTDTNLKAFEDLAEVMNIKFSVNYEVEKDYVIFSDASLLSQIIVNLLSNAFRFVLQEGNVCINFFKQNEYLYVQVSNEGSYIEEDERLEIFDKFYDIKGNKDEKNWSNFGLGLTFSKMAIELLGGKIWVTCEKEPLKTIFHFTIKNIGG